MKLTKKINYWIMPGIKSIYDGDPEVNQIIGIVLEHKGVSKEDIHSKCRKRPLSDARQLIAFFLNENFKKITLQKIAFLMGDRDHATAMYGIRKIKELCEVNYELRTTVNQIRRKISDYKTLKAAA